MKKVKWIVENFTDSEDYKDLINEIKSSGRFVYVIDKNNHFDFKPKDGDFCEGDCVLVQGSIQMTKHISKQLPEGCYPIAYCSWENYLCSNYYEKFKEFLFNDRYKITTLKDLKENKFDYYKEFGKEALMFVRPDSGEKTFQAQLLDLQDFDKFWTNSIASSAKDDDLILVSTPKHVEGEWRFVCSNKPEIIAQSTYRYQGQRVLIPSAPIAAFIKCEEILKVGYYPDSIFCVDICQDADNNFWLMELTSFSSAGLYATDKKKMVEKVNQIVEMEKVT